MFGRDDDLYLRDGGVAQEGVDAPSQDGFSCHKPKLFRQAAAGPEALACSNNQGDAWFSFLHAPLEVVLLATSRIAYAALAKFHLPAPNDRDNLTESWAIRLCT